VAWHYIFETLAYVIAFRLYLRARGANGDVLNREERLYVLAAAILGAAFGSRILFWFEDPAQTAWRWNDIAYLLSGKTIIGALLGGTIAVELTKKHLGIRQRTGDLFAIPIAVGTAIGRIGCLLAGKQDDTFGTPTSVPWGVDLGDGVRRHPVELYELVAMALIVSVLARISPPRFAHGDRYRALLILYFAWRLLVDFLKPYPRFAGLGTLQWACVIALLWYAKDAVRMIASSNRRRELAHG
jgi:prolipoprotein diacylglyceryltransferase